MVFFNVIQADRECMLFKVWEESLPLRKIQTRDLRSREFPHCRGKVTPCC